MKRKVLFLLALLALPLGAKAIENPPLKSLKINGLAQEFNVNYQNQTGYWCGKNNVTVEATALNSNYQISGTGNINVQNGDNVLNVTVTDPKDNSSYTYTINLNVNGDKCSGLNINGNPKTGAFIPVTILFAGTATAFLITKNTKKKKIYKI